MTQWLRDAEIHAEESEMLSEKMDKAHERFVRGDFPAEWIYEVANSADDKVVLDLILSDKRFSDWHDRLEEYVVGRLVDENK